MADQAKRNVLNAEQERALEAKRLDWNRAQQPKWREQLDRDGKVVPGCWVTDDGYKVAKAGVPEPRFIVTRPGDAVAFAYTDRRGDVAKLITADIDASAALELATKEASPCA